MKTLQQIVDESKSIVFSAVRECLPKAVSPTSVRQTDYIIRNMMFRRRNFKPRIFL